MKILMTENQMFCQKKYLITNNKQTFRCKRDKCYLNKSFTYSRQATTRIVRQSTLIKSIIRHRHTGTVHHRYYSHRQVHPHRVHIGEPQEPQNPQNMPGLQTIFGVLHWKQKRSAVVSSPKTNEPTFRRYDPGEFVFVLDIAVFAVDVIVDGLQRRRVHFKGTKNALWFE